MEEREKYIIRQVAFKGAIEALPSHVKWVNASGQYEEPGAYPLVESVFYLTNAFEAIILGTWSGSPKDRKAP